MRHDQPPAPALWLPAELKRPVSPGPVSPPAAADPPARTGRTGGRLGAAVGALLLLAGIGVMAFEPLSNTWTTAARQPALAAQLADPEYAREVEAAGGRIQVGAAAGRIEIPSIDVDVVAVEGTGLEELRSGVGHYSSTAMPGEVGNAAFAGHRSTWGAPFARLDEVAEGAEIVVTTPEAVFTYAVVVTDGGVRPCEGGACYITTPQDVGVLEATSRPTLTLTTCHPRGSDRERLIVHAELIDAAAV